MLLLWKITSLAVSQRLNTESPCDSAVILLSIDWRETKTSLHKNLYINAHSSTGLNRPQVQATQMSISQWMVKQNMVYPYEGILSHDREWSSDAYYNMDRPWEHYAKTMKQTHPRGHILHDSMQFIENVKNRQIHKDRNQICGCQGLGKEVNEEWLLMGTGPLQGDEYVPELDKTNGCTTCEYIENQWIVHFKRYILWYVNFTSIKNLVYAFWQKKDRTKLIYRQYSFCNSDGKVSILFPHKEKLKTNK